MYSDISAATGIVAGNVLLFTEDGRELKQEVLEELWERGGQGAGQSSVSHIAGPCKGRIQGSRARKVAQDRTSLCLPPSPTPSPSPSPSSNVAVDHHQPARQVVYLFNRETFFSEPEHWASQLREEVVLPPLLDCELVKSRETRFRADSSRRGRSSKGGLCVAVRHGITG